jgi:tetratricopeptide (TPR) repeat protein
MWISYGRRTEPLVPPVAGRLCATLARAERWFGPAAVLVLFAYPNPLVPAALIALAASVLARLTLAREVGRACTVDQAIDVGFILLLAGSLVGLAVAHDAEAARVRLTGIIGAIWLYYIVVARLDGGEAARRCAIGLIGLVAGGIVVTLALLRGQLPDSALSRVLSPILAPFGLFPGVSGDVLEVNARFVVHQYGLAHLLLVFGAFAVGLATFGSARTARIGGVLALGVVLPFLLATQARGAIVALVLAAAAVAGLRTRWAWTVLPLGGLAFYALLARGTISRSLEIDWLNDRVSYWTRTLNLLGDFPLTGSGLGARTFAEVFAWYQGLPDPYLVTHTHNIYLQAYAEQGLLGMIGLLIVLAIGVGVSLRAAARWRGGDRWVVAGAAGGLLGSAIYGLTDQVPTSNLSFALVCGLLALGVTAERGRQVAPERARAALLDVSASDVARREVRRRAAPIVVASLVAGIALLGPRWASGMFLNLGAAEVVAAAVQRPQDTEARLERLARGEGLLEAAVAWNPNNVAAHRNLGWVRAMRHDVPGAHAAIAAADRPDTTPFERAQLARLTREAGLIDRAIGLLKSGGDEAQLRDLAAQLWGQRRWRDAAVTYAALTELNPDESEYISNTAIAVLNNGGDVESAMSLLSEAVATNPDAARSLARQLVLRGEPCRADERRGGGRFECAAFWFTLASRVDPRYDRPEVELGSINYYRGRYEAAAGHFAEASRRDPRNPSTYSQLGDSYVQLGRVEEAVAFFERGVEARPERADVHANLAGAYRRVGRREDALRELQTAVELAPDNARYREELARAAAEP